MEPAQNCNLILGDCFEQISRIETDSIDLVLTSPPYNRKRNDKYNNHDDIVDDYVGFLTQSIEGCLRVCSGNVFYNLQKNSYNRSDIHKIMGIFADQIIEVLIWKKTNPMPNPHLINAYEYILVLSKNNKSLKAKNTYTFNHFETNVYSANPYKKIHRAVMNPEACAFILDNFGYENDFVFDPFMGVGTTGIESIKRNMNFVGIELNKEYFEIAENRLKEIKI